MKVKMIHPQRKSILGFSLLLLTASALGGCTRDHRFQPVDMWNKGRLKPYEEVNMPGGTTAMPLPAGAIARGQLRDNDALYTGKTGGKLVTAFPFAITPEVLRRGQERYTIYCSPCHGGMGDGKGQIVQRGFAKPPDYTDPRLVSAPVGHFYDVMTNGYGAMYSYAARVPVNDRWAIAAYIRVLQKAREPGRNGAGPKLTGGGVYSPDLKPMVADEHGEARHGEATGMAPSEAPGVAPGSVVTEKEEAPAAPNPAEGPTPQSSTGEGAAPGQPAKH